MRYPASRFSAPGQAHADVFVRPRHSAIPLRYPDGTATGFELDRDKLLYSVRYKARQKRARDGWLRLDHHEILTVPGVGELVFHRGGDGYLDGGNVKYGHVAVDDVKDSPGDPRPPGDRRGDPAPLSSLPEHAAGYEVLAVRTPPEMLYKRAEDRPLGKSKRGAKWCHYACPACQQGSRKDIHYTVLSWSWLRDEKGEVCGGGGMVRALLPGGAVVHRCNVESIKSGSWEKKTNGPNGEVTGVYVRAELGGNALHGWVMHSHRYEVPGRAPEYVQHLMGL